MHERALRRGLLVMLLASCGAVLVACGSDQTHGRWSSAELVADAGTLRLSGCSRGEIPPCYRQDAGLMPALAIDKRGRATALWQRVDAQAGVWSSRFEPGAGWSPAELVQRAEPGFEVDHVRVAMDSHANATAVWARRRGFVDAQIIQAVRSSAGGGWSAPETVVPQRAGMPEIQLDASGQALVLYQVWTHTEGAGLYVVRGAPGSGWRPPELIQADDATRRNPEESDAIEPGYQLAVDGQGQIAAAWVRALTRFHAPFDEVWSRRFLPGSGWQAPTLVRHLDGYLGVYQLTLGAGAGDNAVSFEVSEAGEAPTNQGVWVQTSSSDTDAEDLYHPDSLRAGESGSAVDPEGNVAAVWSECERTGRIDERCPVYGSWFGRGRRPADAHWTGPQLIANPGRTLQGTRVVSSVARTAVAVWKVDGGIWASRFVLGHGWSTATLVRRPPAPWFLSFDVPQAVMDTGGNVLVTWYETDGVRATIWYSRFDADAPV